MCELGGALASVLRDGRPAIAEVTLRHKAEHQVTVRVRAVPTPNQAGSVIGAAESTDADPWAFYADRRHRKLATLMQMNGVTETQVTQVRGFADQRLHKKTAPLDPSNRRISVIVQYLVKPGTEDTSVAAAGDTPPVANSSEVKRPADVPTAKPASPPHCSASRGHRRHLSHPAFQVG